MLRAACAYALMEMLASYDAKNAKALARVVAAGAQLVVLTPETLRALRNALEQVLDEEAAKSEQFKNGSGKLARVPLRAASLVLGRGRAHRDVGLRADHGAVAVSRAHRGTCAAMQTRDREGRYRRFGRSRFSGASFHAAPRPGQG